MRACGVENFVLLLRGKAGEQRQDVVVAPQRGFAQGFGGFADFALTGQEHENVALAQLRQFVRRVCDGFGDVDFRFVFVVLVNRAVADFHGIGAPAHFQHGRVVEMSGKALGVNGGGGDDDL